MFSVFDTQLLYLTVIMVSVLLAFFALKIKEKWKAKLIIFLIIFILTFLVGFRGNIVGKDTVAYIKIFNFVKIGDFKNANVRELGFLYMTYGLFKIFKNYKILFFIYGFIINSLIILRFWELKEISHFPLMLFIFLSTYYFMTFNIMRQFISVAIIFYASKFIFKKQNIKFFIAIIIAYFFHKTAVLGIGIWFLINVLCSKPNIKNIIIIMLAILISFAFGMYFKDTYLNYLNNAGNFKFSKILIVKLIFTLSFVFYNVKFNYKSILKEKNGINLFNSNWLIYYVGLVLTSLGGFLPYVDRVGLYFMMYEPAFYTTTLINDRIKIASLLFSVIIGGIYLCSLLLNLESAQLIYSF